MLFRSGHGFGSLRLSLLFRFASVTDNGRICYGIRTEVLQTFLPAGQAEGLDLPHRNDSCIGLWVCDLTTVDTGEYCVDDQQSCGKRQSRQATPEQKRRAAELAGFSSYNTHCNKWVGLSEDESGWRASQAPSELEGCGTEQITPVFART